jgi:serine/threonine-protein kinase
MATVFLGRDLRHDRPVAIKVLHPSLAAGLGPERFEREIRLAARLQHPQLRPLWEQAREALARLTGEKVS